MLTMAPIELIINRDDEGYAKGRVFLDDGYTLK